MGSSFFLKTKYKLLLYNDVPLSGDDMLKLLWYSRLDLSWSLFLQLLLFLSDVILMTKNYSVELVTGKNS